MPSRPAHFFESLAGVPVRYDRPPVADYGSEGVARKFHCQPALNQTLDTMFQEIFAKTPASFGAPSVILSAGAYVNKQGQHGFGKAFDLDGIRWAERIFVTLQHPRDKVLYLGVQALCHKYFGVVLGYNYNAAHHDHLHLDIGRSVRFRQTKSVTYFLQEALNSFFDQSLVVDGEYGGDTDQALGQARRSIGLGALNKPENWSAFLDAVADEAFEVAGRQSTAPAAIA